MNRFDALSQAARHLDPNSHRQRGVLSSQKGAPGTPATGLQTAARSWADALTPPVAANYALRHLHEEARLTKSLVEATRSEGRERRSRYPSDGGPRLPSFPSVPRLEVVPMRGRAKGGRTTANNPTKKGHLDPTPDSTVSYKSKHRRVPCQGPQCGLVSSTVEVTATSGRTGASSPNTRRRCPIPRRPFHQQYSIGRGPMLHFEEESAEQPPLARDVMWDFRYSNITLFDVDYVPESGLSGRVGGLLSKTRANN